MPTLSFCWSYKLLLKVGGSQVCLVKFLGCRSEGGIGRCWQFFFSCGGIWQGIFVGESVLECLSLGYVGGGDKTEEEVELGMVSSHNIRRKVFCESVSL